MLRIFDVDQYGLGEFKVYNGTIHDVTVTNHLQVFMHFEPTRPEKGGVIRVVMMYEPDDISMGSSIYCHVVGSNTSFYFTYGSTEYVIEDYKLLCKEIKKTHDLKHYLILTK